MKKCTRCGTTKDLGEFYKEKRAKDGRTSACKSCIDENNRKWRAENPEKIRDGQKRYREENAERVKESGKKWRMENAARRKEVNQAWHAANKDRVRETTKAYRLKNADHLKARSKEYAAANPDRMREAKRKHKEKTLSTPRGKLENAIGANIRNGIKRGSKQGRRTFDLLGYSCDDLMVHLEKQFQPGMSWANYGEWHIDHEIPLAAHNYETPDDIDFKRAWALSNLRPMWAYDNMSKGAKLAKPFQPSLALAAPANDNKHFSKKVAA